MTDLVVKLNIYEGPLDLLLHLIRKNEVDIYDIPIALITTQYLEYIEFMEKYNIELVGDFLLMAATLIQIKTKMLLPNFNNNEEDSEENEDPRMALVRPLLEHIKFKEVAQALELRPILDRDVFVRTNNFTLDDELEDSPFIAASLMDLIKAFKRLQIKENKTLTLNFTAETKTISQRINEIKLELSEKKQISFLNLCEQDTSLGEIVLSFLAVLELAKVNFLKLYQDLKVSQEILLFLSNEKAEINVSELNY